MNSPYTVLGVSPQATDDEVKKAYRALIHGAADQRQLISGSLGICSKACFILL